MNIDLWAEFQYNFFEQGFADDWKELMKFDFLGMIALMELVKLQQTFILIFNDEYNQLHKKTEVRNG